MPPLLLDNGLSHLFKNFKILMFHVEQNKYNYLCYTKIMIKAIIFFDIDGTLLDSQGRIPIENRKAIQLLKSNDCLPVICTGRGRGEMGSLLEETGIDTAILLNGMEILQNEQIIFQDRIDLKSIQKLKDLADQHQHALGYYASGAIKVTTYSHIMRQNFDHFHQELPVISDTKQAEENCQMLLLFSDNPDTDSYYQTAFPQLTFARNSPYSIDITPSGLDKGAGIRRLLHLLLLDKVSTYAFGDGLNDLSMFATVDTAIAMENGRPEALQAADYITLSNDKEGIPHALHHLGLI